MLGKAHFYHEAIKRSVSVFGTVFNDIEIMRTKGSENQFIKVPISYGPKQKWIQRMDAAPNLGADDSSRVAVTLPRLAFEITGLNYDSQRKLGKLKQYKLPQGDDNTVLKTQYAPVPYNISFDLVAIAKNTEDNLQIVEQILPFFTPDFTVTITTVPNTSEKRDVPIILESVTYQDEYEGDFQTRRVVTWTMGFTMKTYLYGSISKSEVIRDVRARTYISTTGQKESTAGRQSEVKIVPNPTNVDVDTSPLSYTETINFFDGDDFTYDDDDTTI